MSETGTRGFTPDPALPGKAAKAPPPARKTVFDDDDAKPAFDSTKFKIEIDDDGALTMTMPNTKAKKKRAPKRMAADDFNRNIAEDIDPTALQSLASYLLEGIDADIQDRSEWEQTVNLTARFLGIKLTDPTAEVSADGTVCKTVATCMLEAAMKMWGTSYAELLPADGPVKAKRVDAIKPPPMPGGGITGAAPAPDEAEPGQEAQTEDEATRDDLADALESDLNWYLTTRDRGYYPDFSKMLMNRNLIGPAFREVYRCPIKKMPISRWIMAQDLIVQGDPADLTDGGRVTARKKVSQAQMRRMMMNGEYLDVGLVSPTGRTSETEMVIGESQGVNPTPSLPRDFDHEVYECYCQLGSGTAHDLFGSLEVLDCDETGEDVGYPLPYKVSIDVDSRTILSIRRHWKQGDDEHRVKRRFVKYGLIPAFGYYDWGLIHLVGNPTLAATMIQRAGVDAALFANFPAWAMGQTAASRGENTVFRPMPGQVQKVPLGGNAKITDVLMPWPYKDPSPQAMAMVQKLEGDVKSLAGIIDIPVGEGRIGNTPVGTIMSYIESVSMVPGAVHKADHIAQAEEFELLRELIADEPELLWRGNNSPARQWQVREEIMAPDISPRADPNTPSQIHRLLKIQGLISASAQPQFQADAQGPIANMREIWKRMCEVLYGTSADEYTHAPQPASAAPPPPPDPRVQAAQIKAQSEQDKIAGKMKTDQLEHEAKMAELALASGDKDADRQAANQREAMKVSTAHTKVGADMATAAIGHAQDEKAQAGQQAHEQQQALNAPLLAPDKGEPSP